MAEAARLMETQEVKRLPVVGEADRLLGIVSRGDLLRIFLRRDEAVREEITEDLLHRTLGLDPRDVTAEVREGRVTLTGTVEQRSPVPVIEQLCRGVDGVVSVTARIAVRTDDPRNAPTGTPRLRAGSRGRSGEPADAVPRTAMSRRACPAGPATGLKEPCGTGGRPGGRRHSVSALCVVSTSCRGHLRGTTATGHGA
ncbi:hypothetical protein GCM10009564_13250 [Streptomyces thermogriseus]|uniref:CBS domain-containing protein n=1 Tax=Streptomyces thermogriseus TaxID=75292 RepID=A0ABP4DHB7_9ACTN